MFRFVPFGPLGQSRVEQNPLLNVSLSSGHPDAVPKLLQPWEKDNPSPKQEAKSWKPGEDSRQISDVTAKGELCSSP